MSVEVTITIPGVPVPKARSRETMRHGKVWNYTPKATKVYENWVRECARKAIAGDPRFPIDGPVALTIRCYLERPKAARRREWPAVRPDLSNVIKSIEDGLGLARVYREDSRVVIIDAEKRYADPGESARAEVTVIELAQRAVEAPREQMAMFVAVPEDNKP